jgi:hypothetical protein
MNRQASFLWKLGYLAAIAVLLVPLYWLNHPEVSAQGRPGGLLAQIRQDHEIAETQLGEVDPTSVTIKLSTFGLRGIAGTVLWMKANSSQMKKDFSRLSATFEQIAKVQPNFVNVWENQCWNLSYNVSAACDDYHDKYYWLMRGIAFLKDGVRANRHEPRLLSSLGQFLAEKMGKADDAKLFRKLFRQDDDYHNEPLPPLANAPMPTDMRDNWLAGKFWHLKAEELVDSGQAPVKGAAEVVFFSRAPLDQFYYAMTLENEGIFGERAQRAWRRASADWAEFAARELRAYEEGTVRLADKERHERLAKESVAALEKLAPGVRERIHDERWAGLSAAQRAAYELPAEKRKPKEQELALAAMADLIITHEMVAKQVKGPQRAEALRLADDANTHETLARDIRDKRSVANFDYWKLRAEAEQTDECVGARQSIYKAGQAYAGADVLEAKRLYEEGLALWRKVLDRFPKLKEDRIDTIHELMEVIKRYRRFLETNGYTFPKPFILQDVIDQAEKEPE